MKKCFISKKSVLFRNILTGMILVFGIFPLVAAGNAGMDSINFPDLVQVYHSLNRRENTDTVGFKLNGGLYTGAENVKLGFKFTDPDVDYALVSVERCNGPIATPLWSKDRIECLDLANAIDKNYPGITIKKLADGEMADFNVSVPGRYAVGVCLRNKKNSTVEKIIVSQFDSYYDDGEWTDLGEVSLNSTLLGMDDTMEYPYYDKAGWTAQLEYHPRLKLYRVVDPFAGNRDFKDYVAAPEETPSTASYVPKGYVLDRTSPSWLIINAEDPHDMYSEPTFTGFKMFESTGPVSYACRRYNEKAMWVKYTLSPKQDVYETGYFMDDPTAKNLSMITVNFAGWSDVPMLETTSAETPEYYTLDGLKVMNPTKGIYIKRQGSKTSKITL